MKNVILVLIVLVAGFMLSGCDSARNGTHTGYITAIQNEGVIFKKDFVFIKTDRSSSQEDKYCIDPDNSSLTDILRKAEQDGTKVTLKYNTRINVFAPDLCDEDYITSVLN